MHIRIGLENNIEGRTLAWALDYPGCFAYGADEPEALIRMTRALLKYEIWIKDHTPESWVDFSDLDIRVVERFDTFHMNDNYCLVPEGQGYEINAWFHDDWRPLGAKEVEQALKIFTWQREELLGGVSTLAHDILEMERAGERWTIIGIMKHIANAELWYLSRLGLAPFERDSLASDPEDRLNQTAALVEDQFQQLVDSVKVLGIDGEFWSPRKVLRRTLWHQRDHIEHIKKLVL
jgi:uncharacterized damage-inducible protein DinB